MPEEGSDKKMNYSQNPVVLSAKHVSKCFKLPTEQATGLKQDRKSTRLNSSHMSESRMPSSA